MTHKAEENYQFPPGSIVLKMFPPSAERGCVGTKKNTTTTMSAPSHNMLQPRHPNINATQQPN